MNDYSANTISGNLADFFSSIRIEDLPQQVVKKAKELLLDTIGVGINGSAHQDARPVLDIVLESRGAEESVVWGHGAKVPAHAAAFVNGTFAHCIELDDTHRATYLHAGAFVVPTALAVAEKTGASGKDLLVAIIAGYEAAIRIALSVSPEHRLRGFHTTGTVGVFGAAMAASLLLKLNREQTINALGLAGTQSAGLFQFLYDGSMAKRFHPGRSAQSGILAAQLAEKGFTGPREILEGPYGFGRVMSNRFDPAIIINQLGTRWHVMEVGIKPYSACRFCHAPIDGALQIRETPDFDPSLVESVEVLGSQQLFDQTGNQEPRTTMAAQLSTPFCVALALVSGQVMMPEDIQKGLADRRVMEMARRVKVVVDPTLEVNSRQISMKVKMASGEEKRAHVALPLGEPERPLSHEYLQDKFMKLGAAVLKESGSKRLYEVVKDIERLENTGQLARALVP